MLWIASITSWSYETLAEMPVNQLLDWKEEVLRFHQDRLSEQTPVSQEPQSRMPQDRPLTDFF